MKLDTYRSPLGKNLRGRGNQFALASNKGVLGQLQSKNTSLNCKLRKSARTNDGNPMRTQEIDMAKIRPIRPDSQDEIRLVAERMRLTLIEVLEADRGGQMYELDWLEDRVRFHLDGNGCTGQVFVAVSRADEIMGHTIVRLETDDSSSTYGLFSTIYVAEDFRGAGVAQELIEAGEDWILGLGQSVAVTYTHPENHRLHRLFGGRGYACTPINDDFVKLEKNFPKS